jgi:hypothetical protein
VVLRSGLDLGNAHADWEVALVYAQFAWNYVGKHCLVRLLVKTLKLPMRPVANQPQKPFHREISYNTDGTDWEDFFAGAYADSQAAAANSTFKLGEWASTECYSARRTTQV